MASLDMSKFTFTDEQIRDVRDLVWENITKAPELANYFTIITDVVSGKQVGFIGEGGLILKADNGCGSEPSDWKIATRTITWSPVAFEGYVRECYADLRNTAAVYALHKGVKMADLEGTDYIAIVVDVFVESIKKSIIAEAVFGNKTDGKEHNNLFDGFLKQMDTQVATNAAQKVALTENNIINDVIKMITSADPVLRADRTAKIYATQKVYDAILSGLVSANASTTAYANLLNGMEISILGVKVEALPIFDEVATLVEGKKNFAFYSAPKYLAIGTDTDDWGEIDVHYDAATKYTHLRTLGTLDAKITNPKMFVLGELA